MDQNRKNSMICPKCGKDSFGSFCDLCGESLNQNSQSTMYQTDSRLYSKPSGNPQPFGNPQHTIQPQMQTMAPPQYQNQQYSGGGGNSPSSFAIIISGIIPIAGWIMGFFVAITGQGKKGGFYFVNGTVCFILGIIATIGSYMFGTLGGIFGLAMAASFIGSRNKKVQQGEIQF